MIRSPLLLAIALLSVIGHASAAETPKPNFIVINIDDLGYADLGAFGSKLNRTPHLDRMAAEGRKLTCFYAAPVCSPSRASLMTGCYPKRALSIPGVLFPAGAVGLHPDEVTIAELLKAEGYATACIGKWHLGDQPEFLPTRQGFDTYLGIPYSNDMGTAADGSKSDLGKKTPDQKLSRLTGNDETGLRGASQPPLPLLENGKVIARVRADEQQAIVETYTKAALQFIAQHKDKPFFLYLPHTAVHFPLYPGKKWAGRSPHGLYSDWVEEMDASVGEILDSLRSLKLDARTLVLFTSDNGGTPRGSNGPLRGHKASVWEGGMRAVTIAWWPGKIPAGTASDAIAGMRDVLPTFVKLAGGKLPAERKLDGADLWPILGGDAGAKGPHDTFHFFRGLELEAMRSGDWKLHLKSGELYHLGRDLGERTDVASANPEVVQRLRALAAEMDTDLGNSKIGPGCRPLGRVTDPKPIIDLEGRVRAEFGGGRFP
jgi:arylsulfatase A